MEEEKHTIYQFTHRRGDRQNSACFTRVCLPADAPTNYSNSQDRTQCARAAADLEEFIARNLGQTA
jgi:hypothetical protein